MRSPLVATIVYCLLGAAWIVTSDLIVATMVEDIALRMELQTYKGLAFIAVTGAFLYLILFLHHRSLRVAEAGKGRVFKETMETVQHIVFNFLNAMQYYKLRAENSGALDDEALKEYDLVIDKAAEKLRELGEISTIETSAIVRYRERDFMD